MKHNKRSIKRIFSAVLAGLMMMTAGAALTASADDTYSTDHTDTSLISVKHSKAYLKRKQEQEQREKEERKKAQIKSMYYNQKKIVIENCGIYHAKSVKLYGRRVV